MPWIVLHLCLLCVRESSSLVAKMSSEPRGGGEGRYVCSWILVLGDSFFPPLLCILHNTDTIFSSVELASYCSAVQYTLRLDTRRRVFGKQSKSLRERNLLRQISLLYSLIYSLLLRVPNMYKSDEYFRCYCEENIYKLVSRLDADSLNNSYGSSIFKYFDYCTY